MNRNHLTVATNFEQRIRSLLYGLLVLVTAVSIGYGATSLSGASAKELWLQDADPFQESAKDPSAAPLIEVSRSQLTNAITGTPS